MIVGLFIALLGALMILPAIADLVVGNKDWQVFAASSGVSLFVGFGLWASGRSSEPVVLTLRQAFLLTALSWISLAGFAALPFAWSGLGLDLSRAIFEATSGITTTGGTVLTGLDKLPPGILLWRAILHFYGGIGVVVLAIAVLPMLRIGGMQLFRAESSDRSEKIFPAAAQIAGSIFGVYLTLNLACAVAYMLAGMTPFQALLYGMSTISTGGLAPNDASIGFFQSAAIEWIAIIFMLSGALPFALYIHAVRGRPYRFLKSSEVRTYVTIILVAVVALWAYVEIKGIETGSTAFRHSIFNVVTLITTTGFSTVDYSQWGTFVELLLFGLMLSGGCSGSTAGGIKPLRILITAKTVAQQLRRMIYPNGVFPIIFEGHSVSEEVVRSVNSFFIAYGLAFAVVALALSATGVDFLTAVSATVANLSNVGPALGQAVGPAGNYFALPDSALWVLSAAMLVGRLEIFTILILFLPRFWRP